MSKVLTDEGLAYLLQLVDNRFATNGEVTQIASTQANQAIQNQLQAPMSPLGLAMGNKANSADLATIATSGSYSDLADKPTIPSSAADVSAVAASAVGSANGVASLDSNGRVPASQLPSYVDDVVECQVNSGQQELGANWLLDLSGNLIVPESGKIYVVIADNSQYRWGGTTYVQLASSSGVSSMTNSEIQSVWENTFGSITVMVVSDNVNTSSILTSYTNRAVIEVKNTTDGPMVPTSLVVSSSLQALGTNPSNWSATMLIISNNTVQNTVNNFNAIEWRAAGVMGFTGGFGPGTYQIVVGWEDPVVEPDPGGEGGGGESTPVVGPDPGPSEGGETGPNSEPTGTDVPTEPTNGDPAEPTNEPTDGEQP